MKSSDKVEMTLNIVGELIKLNVDFDDQNSVREVETAIRLYYERLKKDWPNNSDMNLLAMIAFQFAKSYQHVARLQENAIDVINSKKLQVENILNNSPSIWF